LIKKAREALVVAKKSKQGPKVIKKLALKIATLKVRVSRAKDMKAEVKQTVSEVIPVPKISVKIEEIIKKYPSVVIKQVIVSKLILIIVKITEITIKRSLIVKTLTLKLASITKSGKSEAQILKVKTALLEASVQHQKIVQRMKVMVAKKKAAKGDLKISKKAIMKRIKMAAKVAKEALVKKVSAAKAVAAGLAIRMKLMIKMKFGDIKNP